MLKIILSAVLFLAVFAAPSHAAPPSERYAQALLLLEQSEAAVAMALEISPNSSPDAAMAESLIFFARESAQKAVDGREAGNVRQNAQTAAEAANLGAVFAYSVFLVEENPDAALLWWMAADYAQQAAEILDRKYTDDAPF